MYTVIIIGLIILISLSVSAALWRSRQMVLRQLFEVRLQLAAAREKAHVLETQQQSHDQMNATFKGLAATALESSLGQFLNLAQVTFDKARDLDRSEGEHRQQAIGALIKPVAETLERYQTQIQRLELERQKAFQSIDSELRRVAETHAHLARETSALKDALKRPHVRGRWGEVQLRNCIELAGMSEYSDVVFQDVETTEDGARHIPDLIVRMPGGRQVIVDAKTPLDAFLNSLEAATEELRHAEMVRHGRHVREHVKRLATRAYSEFLKDSADFTVMFLPNESFLYAALEVEPDIVEFALQKKVLIATPPTLIGLLKVVRFGWNETRLAENAQQISELGAELHKRLCDFLETFMSIGKQLDRAKEEFDKGRQRLESRVLTQARKFETLGAKSAKTLLDSSPPPG